MIDLMYSFKIVSHEVIQQKLDHRGGYSIGLVKSYLPKSKQFENIIEYHSKMISIECGVLQGSVVGPILLLPYINDYIIYLTS